MGAFDYISKPPDLNRLLTTVRNALDRKELVVENKILKKKVSKNYEMIGESKEIRGHQGHDRKSGPYGCPGTYYRTQWYRERTGGSLVTPEKPKIFIAIYRGELCCDFHQN